MPPHGSSAPKKEKRELTEKKTGKTPCRKKEQRAESTGVLLCLKGGPSPRGSSSDGNDLLRKVFVGRISRKKSKVKEVGTSHLSAETAESRAQK